MDFFELKILKDLQTQRAFYLPLNCPQNSQLRGSLGREQAMYPDMFSVCVCVSEEVYFPLVVYGDLLGFFFQVFGGAECDRILG